ncbi:gamma-parvin isoform X2 [Pogoniulus pusillus]|uniref:gamma-parvin isoform X2 n=1 Tax=Pogoniulus pusillus TaxID=488313 RepID=UPI0030B9A375
MEEQACVSGVVGLHVSCICSSVYFSLQQGPSRQTMKFRMRLRFRFCEQPVPCGTASSCHTLSAWHCPTWEAAASGRLQDAQPGQSVPSPRKFHHACGKKILDEKVPQGENSYQEQEQTMDPDFLNAFIQPPAVNEFLAENVIAQGEKKRFINPSSSKNPKLEELKLSLIDWINTTLKEEHIVVRSLEEDLYDGLVLHHLMENLASLKLDVDEIALTEKKQRQKLSVILEAVAKCLQLEESQLKWSVESILTKDLLSTLHLLVAIAKHFEPNLAIPSNVQVETVTIENTSRGLKTANGVEYITENKENLEAQSKDDAFDELFSHAPDKLDAVKKVFLQFVNQHVGKLGLNLKDLESQVACSKFADGVILLLLIGQLEGYFLNLRDFFLTPASTAEMLHNVNLALDLLADGGLLDFSVNSEDIVNGDLKSTMRILYCLYSKYKTKGT